MTQSPQQFEQTAREQRLLAQFRQRQLELARSGRYRESAHFADLARQLREQTAAPSQNVATN